MLPQHALLDAISRDDSLAVQQALLDGADARGLDCDGRSMLYLAEHSKANSVVRSLVLAGADVNERINACGDTLLHHAPRKENCGFANAPLDAKANCNLQTVKGETALPIAAKLGLTFIVKRLLNSDAKVYIRTKKGEFPLDLAIAAGQTETAQTIDRFIAARTRFHRDLGDPCFEEAWQLDSKPRRGYVLNPSRDGEPLPVRQWIIRLFHRNETSVVVATTASVEITRKMQNAKRN